MVMPVNKKVTGLGVSGLSGMFKTLLFKGILED